MSDRRKQLGQFFTPSDIARSLVSWVVEKPTDRVLDPSCGDGGFLVWHQRAVGVELDLNNARIARERAPSALVHGGDFFRWATSTKERFEAIAGNPPFIRYQNFAGDTRAHALAAATMMGADFSALTSSWAPFVIVAAGLLKPGGRMAFVVPAEIGHAGYARTLLPALCARFARVQIVACREKLFPQLSEDCWLLHCTGYGAHTNTIHLSVLERFVPNDAPPTAARAVSLAEWRAAGERLRPFLLPTGSLALYQTLTDSARVRRLGELASAGIGYVTGANEFFHLRPSEAERRGLPRKFLRVAVRKTEQLPDGVINKATVRRWLDADAPVLLLDLREARELPASVRSYLDEEPGQAARLTYKCKNRAPWYVVPDIKVPDAFLSVMSGTRPTLVRNEAACVCTNSLHAVVLRPGVEAASLQRGWNSPLAQLGAEIEGHPLGGGMLKLEPREATRVPVPIDDLRLSRTDAETLAAATRRMRAWRHQAAA